MELYNVEEYARSYSHVLFRGTRNEDDGHIEWWFYGAYESLDRIGEVIEELGNNRPYLVVSGSMLP